MNQETFEAVTAEFKIPNACNDVPYHRRQHEQAERLGWLCTRATGLLQFLWAQGLLQYRAQLTELTQKAVSTIQVTHHKAVILEKLHRAPSLASQSNPESKYGSHLGRLAGQTAINHSVNSCGFASAIRKNIGNTGLVVLSTYIRGLCSFVLPGMNRVGDRQKLHVTSSYP